MPLVLEIALSPTSLQLREIAMLRRGLLSEVPFALLLRALSEGQKSTVLEIRKGPLEKRIVFERGIPVDCVSNLAHERLGRFLIQLGRMQEAELAPLLSESVTAEVPLGTVMLRRGLLTPSELYRLLQQNLAKKLLDGFSWSEGEFELVDEPPRVDAPLKVRTHQLILTGLTRFATQERIDLVVMTVLGQRLCLEPSPPTPVDTLRLNPAQTRVVDALQSQAQDMSTLAAAASLELSELSRIVYAFGVLGLIGVEEDIKSRAPADEPVKESLRRSQPLPILNLAKVEEDSESELGPLGQEELMQLYLGYRQCDAFDLLGLPEEALPRFIEEAFLSFASRLLAWLSCDEEAQRDRAGDLLLAGARAYATLADPPAREALIAERSLAREAKLNPQPQSAPQPDGRHVGPRKIQTDLLDPVSQFQKGKALLDAGSPGEAVQYLAFAVDCDPQNGLYRSELAFARYISDPSKADSSLEMLTESRRIDPKCPFGWFYAGEILRDLGRYDEAEPLLQAAIKPMSPDRRPIDALRELNRQRKG